MRSLWILTLCFFHLWVSSQATFSQDGEKPPQKVQRVEISAGGLGIYRPGTWGVLNVSLRNPMDRDIELLVSTHFVEDPTLQFGRRVWMPAHSRGSVWHPIRMPENSKSVPGMPDIENKKFFELRSQAIVLENGKETLSISETGAMEFDHSLRIAADSPATGIIGKPGISESEYTEFANPVDFLLTSRFDRGLTTNFTYIGPGTQIVTGEESLGAVDHLVVYDDRVINNLTQVSAIRRWVAGGGKLWIMADQVSEHVLNELLGEVGSLATVSEAELTHVEVVAAPRSLGASPFIRDLDRPVKMVRVIGPGWTPDFLCDGWPASLWKNYGSGKILVTTIGADGWVSPRRPEDPLPPSGSSFQTRFVPGQPLATLAAEFFTRKQPALLSKTTTESIVQDMIGYRIPSRGLVVGALLIFTGLIVGGGYWLWRTGRLEQLGLLIPALSIVTAGILLIVGKRTQAEIPEATAVMEIVQAVPGTNEARVSGIAGVLSRDQADAVLPQGEWGGWNIPDMTGLEGSNRRLVWSDLDHWSWELLDQKPGLRTHEFQAGGLVDRPLQATAGFQDGQLRGQLTLPAGHLASDVILATASGRLGVNVDLQGKWSINQEELGSSQYLTATVLSDEQQRRSQLLMSYLNPSSKEVLPVIPTLFAWTKPWNSAVKLGTTESTGSALIEIPLEWEPLVPGTVVTLPRALLTFRELIGPDGVRPTGFFDVRARQWVERSGSTSGWIAFETPHQLLPLRTKTVEFTFQVSGPLQRLELLGFRDGKPQSLRVWDNPVGTVRHTVEDGSLLPIDALGRMYFRLDVGPQDVSHVLDPSQNLSEAAPKTYWKFEDISVRITADVPSQSGDASRTP